MQPSLRLIQGRGEIPNALLRGKSGSAMMARVVATRSTPFPVSTCSAISAFRIRPATTTGTPVALLIRPPMAPATFSGSASPGTKIEVVRGVYPVPSEMLSRSTVPPAVMACATSTSSSGDMPPLGSIWSPVIRKPTKKSSDVDSRTACSASRPKRTRFSSDPP